VEAGYIPIATPVFQGRPGQRLMLIGQAPGVVEMDARKPFAARAGKELERWMKRAGFTDDDHFRSIVYLTSVTKCFPGKAASGGGDRRPSAAEVALCRPWLQGQLALVEPRMVLLVGTLAIEQFMPGRSLDGLVGRLFDAALLLPLPHPSGASRWLNQPAHRGLLEQALGRLRATWPALTALGSG
jgi:uracil-DNA glycosylase